MFNLPWEKIVKICYIKVISLNEILEDNHLLKDPHLLLLHDTILQLISNQLNECSNANRKEGI